MKITVLLHTDTNLSIIVNCSIRSKCEDIPPLATSPIW